MAKSGSFMHWFNPGAYSLINQVSIVLLGFGSIFFLVRIVSPAEIGVWFLFTSVASILDTLRNGFVRNPFVSMLVVADKEEHAKIVQSSLTLHFLLTFLVVISLIVSAELLAKFWYAESLENLFYIYSANSVVLIVFLHFEYFLQSKLEFKTIFITNFIRLFAFFCYVVIYYINGNSPSLSELAIVQLCATVIASFFSYQLVRGKIPAFQMNLLDLKIFNKLFHLGKYTFGTNISAMIIKNTDSWMIGRLISTAGVAIYNPAIRITNIVEVPTIAISNILFPKVGSKMRDSGVVGVQSIYYKAISLILAVMIPVVFPVYFMSDSIIMVIFGKEYMEAVPILQVTIFYTILVPFSLQFGTIMDALQLSKLNFYLSMSTAFLNVVLNFFLIQSFGVIGAAYSSIISYCVMFTVNQSILYYKFKINTWFVFKGIIEWYSYGWRFIKIWTYRQGK